MTKIVPDIPGCTVTGYLYDSSDPRDLGQDMVEVRTVRRRWWDWGRLHHSA